MQKETIYIKNSSCNNVSSLNCGKKKTNKKKRSHHHRCVSVCLIPVSPLLSCIALPQICSTESGASDVTCGWLYCSLHHLWILLHPLKRENQTVSIIQKGKQVRTPQPYSFMWLWKWNIILFYPLCRSTIKVFSPSNSLQANASSLCFPWQSFNTRQQQWCIFIVVSQIGQQGNREVCGSLSFKAKVSVWKPTKSIQKKLSKGAD